MTRHPRPTLGGPTASLYRCRSYGRVMTALRRESDNAVPDWPGRAFRPMNPRGDGPSGGMKRMAQAGDPPSSNAIVLYLRGLLMLVFTSSRPPFIHGHEYPDGVWFNFPSCCS